MPAFFVAAVGTGVGKTFFTSMCCKQLLKKKIKASAIKPVMSGYTEDKNDHENDIFTLMKAQNMPINEQNVNIVSLYRLQNPISPDIAARKEGVNIDYDKLYKFCADKIVQSTDKYLLIEGVGGIMVPLSESKTTLDLIVDLKIPVILITGTYLGCLNHTLTTIEVLNGRSIEIQAIVVNESKEALTNINEIVCSLMNFTDIPINQLPRLTNIESDWHKIPDLTNIIIENDNEERKAS